MSDLRITVWNEFRHEKEDGVPREIYPDGIHTVIAEGFREHGFTNVRTATLDEPENGLPDSVLAETDVLTWWGHKAHKDVDEATVERVQQRVWEGMGLLVLHSGHHSKVFRRLMGTSCSLRWREAAERERIWVVNPAHPIAQGLGPYFEVPEVEMYGEHFDIPTPDELVFISWFEGGEVFRSGCCFYRGHGKIFYFRPGHETHPIFYQKEIRQVLASGARWAAPSTAYEYRYDGLKVINVKVPLEPLGRK
jgi:trehalose utilization protein